MTAAKSQPTQASSIAYDIGLPSPDTQVPIRVEWLASQIMEMIPAEYRASTVRAIAHACHVIEEGREWESLDVFRATLPDGTKLKLSVSFKPLEDDDMFRTIMINGSIVGAKMVIKSGYLILNNVPESIVAQITPGKDLTDIVEMTLLEDVKLDQHEVINGKEGIGLKVSLIMPQCISYERAIHEWEV